jgi:hypothetical protein
MTGAVLLALALNSMKASATQKGSCGTIANWTVFGGTNYHGGGSGNEESWFVYDFDNLHTTIAEGFVNSPPDETAGFHQNNCGQ